jgi:hypothetical protein
VIHVIKTITAHPRITLVAGTSVAAVVGAKILGLEISDMVSQTGNGLSYAYKYIKAAGIVTALIGFLFILFRYNILGFKMAPENSAFMVAKRGKIARDKDGAVVLYESGRNRWHVINYRHLAPVHFGDRFVSLGVHEFTVAGITWKRHFELRFQIPKDKTQIERTVTSVSDQNWWDGKFNMLQEAVGKKAVGQLTPLLRKAWVNEEDNTPEFDVALAEELFGKALCPYGVKYCELIASPVSRTDAQQQKDGNVAIADAIAGVRPSSGLTNLLKWFKRLLG